MLIITLICVLMLALVAGAGLVLVNAFTCDSIALKILLVVVGLILTALAVGCLVGTFILLEIQ